MMQKPVDTTSRPSAWIPAIAAPIALTLAAVYAAPRARAADNPRPAAPITIATVGQTSVTEAAIIAASQSEFDRLQDGYELEKRRLEIKYAKSRHDLLQRELDKTLDQDALTMEAAARGVTTETVLSGLTLITPTEDEVRAFYDANVDRIRQPYDEVHTKVLQYLTEQRNKQVTRDFYDALRAKHGIRAELAPFRVSVAALGPVRGQTKAAVTIVEFGDFQCPYCKEAETSLRKVMARYPNDVRLVFRNLPLTQIHPDAQLAAEAAVCADRQGKFWEMHDAMYADQSALKPEGLKNTAQRLGLDTNRFSTCITDGSTTEALGIDAKAAQDLGLSGTPYFFINGRPVDGNVPEETFNNIIAEELRREPKDRG
jgi:protein-disulfide isomerase